MKQLKNAQRIEELKKKIELYEAAGALGHRNCAFAHDMIMRMQAGKSPTRAQQEWIDSIVASDVPQVQYSDTGLFADIKCALAVNEITPYDRGVLEDFSRQLMNGRALTEKQRSFASFIIARARDIKNNSFWIPGPDEIAFIDDCRKLLFTYKSTYLYTHPSIGRLAERFSSFITHLNTNSDIREATLKSRIKQDDIKRASEVLVSHFKSLHNSKLAIGSLVCRKVTGDELIILTVPYIAEGVGVVCDVLDIQRNAIAQVNVKNIAKYRKKKNAS